MSVNEYLIKILKTIDRIIAGKSSDQIKLERAGKNDQKGHYGLDGVSYDGQEIYISGGEEVKKG